MAFPRIFQRLFANSGAGPKLRHDIIPWDEESRIASIAPLEAWRQAMIGTPMPMASTTLPPGFMWADGSFASFATYPELKAKYDAGGFAGMLLPYTAQEGNISAFPGKFKPDAANPTGLFVPRLNGLFARYWTPGAGEGAGAWHRDEIRNITGWMHAFCTKAPGVYYAGNYAGGGPFSVAGIPTNQKAATAAYNNDQSISMPRINFNTSLVVPTGTQNVPQHVWQPVALYLGRAAQV